MEVYVYTKHDRADNSGKFLTTNHFTCRIGEEAQVANNFIYGVLRHEASVPNCRKALSFEVRVYTSEDIIYNSWAYIPSRH